MDQELYEKGLEWSKIGTLGRFMRRVKAFFERALKRRPPASPTPMKREIVYMNVGTTETPDWQPIGVTRWVNVEDCELSDADPGTSIFGNHET